MTNREEVLAAFLDDADWGNAERRPITGDASLRRYERLTLNGLAAILMDWPAGPDAPVEKGHSAYSKVALLAEDVRPFVAVGDYLRGLGLRAPECIAQDLEHGFLLLEDLGDADLGGLIDQGQGPAGENLDQIYDACVETLVTLQSEKAPEKLPVGDGTHHIVPAFDDGIYRIETAMPLDWYLPVVMGREATDAERDEYAALWSEVWPIIEAGPRTLFLRDFHSPNIIWQSGAAGVAQVGLIDYQDALIGSRAYDLVSVLQDARRDVPLERELHFKQVYCTRMQAEDSQFDREQFEAAYAVLGAERALRLVGLWPRLLKRDGKPHYMAHMARTMNYLARNLEHPALAHLKSFVDLHFLKDAPAPGKIAETT